MLGCSSSNAQSLSTHAKHNSTASTKKRRSHLEPSVPLRAENEQESTAKRTPATVARAWANFSLQRKLRWHKKQSFVQILTYKSHPWCSSFNAIRQEWLAKHNQNRKTVLQSSYLSTSVDATIPLRSADTELQRAIELQHTKELQHTTVEHIAWMQQLQCTKPRKTNRNRRQSGRPQASRAREPTFLRNGSSVYPKKKFSANPKIQIASMMQQFQCDPPRMTCKTQSESQDSTAEQLPFDQRWCNHSTAVCRHWVETHHRIATHYCRTHCLDAAVPMHKASQHMQNTIAQHQQRKEEVTWNHQFHCARKTNRNRRQSGRPQPSRARVSQLFSATESPFTQNKVLCKS